MSFITDEFIKSLAVRAGTEAIERDIELLERYRSNAIGCGLESLDNPTGQLIESGLAARYPEHYKVGSGLEGIGGLVDTLKKALGGLKKAGRGKVKPFIDKQTKTVAAQVKDTYVNQKWLDEHKENHGMIDHKPVTAFTGSVENGKLDELIAAGKDVLTLYTNAVKDSAKKTQEFWNKLKPFEAKARKAEKGSDEAKAVLEEMNKAFPEGPIAALPKDLPKITNEDNGGKGPALSKAEVKEAGEFILAIFAAADEIWSTAEQCRVSYGFGDSLDEEVPDKALVSKLDDLGYWDDLSNNVSDMAETASTYFLGMAKGFESLIVKSLK